jgi:hypothetical protein
MNEQIGDEEYDGEEESANRVECQETTNPIGTETVKKFCYEKCLRGVSTDIII